MARVAVRGYTKRDGTRVSSYTRSAPGRTAAAVLGLALTVGGVSGLGGASPRPVKPSGRSSQPTATPGQRAAKTADAVLRLGRKGFRVSRQISADGPACATHSYGQVRGFFRQHECVALFRASFEVRDRRRNVVLVAVAWVDMPDVSGAAEFRALVDRDGTGNITELSRERGRYRGVRFTGDVYTSRRDGALVINAQAQPVSQRAATKAPEAAVKTVLEAVVKALVA